MASEGSASRMSGSSVTGVTSLILALEPETSRRRSQPSCSCILRAYIAVASRGVEGYGPMKPRQPSTTQAQAVVEGKVPSPSDLVRQMWQRGAREGLRHSSGGGFFIGERKPCRFKRSSARNVRQTYPLEARYVCEQLLRSARGRLRPLGPRPAETTRRGSRPARSRSGATRTSCRSSRRRSRGSPVGLTPLQRAPRLAERLGLGEVWVKNDTANPTHSFKDRVVAVALAKAQELGYEVVACASTGNLAERGGGACRRGGARVVRVHPVGPRGAEGARHRASTAPTWWPCAATTTT